MWTIITDGIQLNCVDTYLTFLIKYSPAWISAGCAILALHIARKARVPISDAYKRWHFGNIITRLDRIENSIIMESGRYRMFGLPDGDEERIDRDSAIKEAKSVNVKKKDYIDKYMKLL